MKTWLLAGCLSGLLLGGEAQAGHGLFKHKIIAGSSVPGTTSGYCATCGQSSTSMMGTNSVVAGNVGGDHSFGNPPARPYSYYAAAPGTARGYYGYGEDQFPYYGRAYGHPYDPWTWPYLSYGYQNSLNRYYEPPVR